MLLNKLNDHYENIILDFFEFEKIEKTSKGLVLIDNCNSNDKIIKLHAICSLLPEDVVLNHVETIVMFGQYIKIPKGVLEVIDSYQERFKEDYILVLKREFECYRFSFYSKEYEYKVHSFIECETKLELIAEKLEIFVSKEIKLPEYIIDNIIEDVEENFLNGYDIDFNKYRKELIVVSRNNNKNDYMVLFSNEESGKQIIVYPIDLNEGTGDVFFAGRYNDMLKMWKSLS